MLDAAVDDQMTTRPAVRDLLVALICSNEYRSVLEIGTWKGKTARVLAHAARDVTTIDVNKVDAQTWPPNLEVIQADSRYWSAADRTWDLIFVDGGFTGGQRADDVVRYLPRLNRGGIMVVDDYDIPVIGTLPAPHIGLACGAALVGHEYGPNGGVR